MSRKGRLAALFSVAAMVLCTAAGATPPVCVDPGGGIGGTGAPLAGMPGGMGGTGDQARGGVGGTGAPADGGIGGTGIVGTITGFASICVNGVEVHYDAAVPVSENGVEASPARLAVGQVVAVEAAGSDGGLKAERIAILNAYEGPLTSPGIVGDSARVMGQQVRLAPGARVDQALRGGDRVRVSGLRNAAGEVVATRIERAAGLREDSAIGPLDALGALQGLPLTGAGHGRGAEVLVRGAWRDGRLDVALRAEDPSVPFAGRVRNAVIEGLVSAVGERELRVGGFHAQLGDGTRFAGGDRSQLAADRRVRIHGTFLGPREIRAARVELVSDRILVGEERHRRGGEDDQDDGAKRDDTTSKVRMENDRERIEVETESGSERNERRFSEQGQLERERIEREIESPEGDRLRRERIEVRQSGDRIETRERIEVFEGGRRVERIDRVDRVDRSDRVDRVERPEKIDKPERVERPDKIERPEKVERPDRD